jgi:hypothetical protein
MQLETITYENKLYDINSIIVNSRFDILDYAYENNLLRFSLSNMECKETRSSVIQELILTSTTARNIYYVLKWLHSNGMLEFNTNTYGCVSMDRDYVRIYDWIFEEQICDMIINLDLYGFFMDDTRMKYFIQLKREFKPIYFVCTYLFIDFVSTSNNLKLLDCLFDNRDIIEFKYSSYAIDYAHSEVLNWWYHKHTLGLVEFKYSDGFIRNAMFKISTLKWWIDHSQEFKINPLCNCIQFANLETLKYIIEDQNFFIIKVTPDLLISLVNITNRPDILEYLFENRDKVGFEIDERVVDMIIANETLEWFYSKYKLGLLPFIYSGKAIMNAINRNLIDVLKWWIDHADVLEIKYDLNMLIFVNTYKLIKYILLEQNVINIPIHYFIDNCQDDIVLNSIYENRHLHGFDYTSKCIDYSTNSKVLDWWFTHANVLELKYTEMAIDNACNNNYINIICLWYEKKFDVELKFTKEILLKYINEELEQRKFLLELVKN